MPRNNYTSASDRRWQRRYERIQQRREEELERRDRRGRDADERIEDPFQQSELYAELLRRQKVGDVSELDSFLGNFLAPGA